MILQHRGLSARGPGAHPMRPLAQPTFVDEDVGAPLAERFFLSCGQRTRFPYRIVSSSRSSARPVVPLAAPAELAADAPDGSFVIAHPALVLDQLAPPARGPQPAGVAERLGSALERLLDLAQLASAQLGLTPGPARLLQTRPTGLSQLPRPANHRLPMDAQPPCHLTLAHAPLEQLRRCHPAPFQSRKVPPHTCCIAHVSRLPCVSILYKGQ